jgi:hypothetical protein
MKIIMDIDKTPLTPELIKSTVELPRFPIMDKLLVEELNLGKSGPNTDVSLGMDYAGHHFIVFRSNGNFEIYKVNSISFEKELTILEK